MINPSRISQSGKAVVTPLKRDPKIVRVNFFPQDPRATSVEIDEMQSDFVTNEGLSGPRDFIQDNGKPVPSPDGNGNMLYSDLDPRFDQVEVFLSAHRTLAMWEKYFSRRIDYAFGDYKLKGIPHAGEDFNAYYARWEKSINFFYKYDGRLGKTIQSAQSNEVVSHEKGHATLDGLKPGLLGSWSTEAGAFHESFGDISSILISLGNDQVVTKLLAETGGDVRKPNVVTRLAEELSCGIADVNLKLPPEQADKFIIRDAANKLVWQDPKTLPDNPSDPEKLGKEVHNFSRLFTGAVWDIFSGIYGKKYRHEEDARGSIANAKDEVGLLVAKMLEFAPDAIKTYKQLGKAMLVADAKSMGGRNRNIIVDVMLKRKILTEEDVKNIESGLKNLPKISVPQVYQSLESENQKELDLAQDLLVKNQHLLGLNKEDLPVVSQVIRNNKGESFYHYKWVKEVELQGSKFKRYNGAFIDVAGSLVLAFDFKGDLMHVEKTPVTQEVIDSSKEHVAMLINDGLVKYFKPSLARSSSFRSRDLFKSDGQPYAAYTTYENKGTKMKVEPVPILV